MFGVLEIILRRDLIPRESFGAGQIQIALIVSLGALRTPRLGAGEPGRSSSPGLGCSRHCVGHAFAISAQLCRRWMTLRSVVHIGPYAARRKPRDVDWRNCQTAAQSAGAMPQGRRSNCDGCARRLGAALDLLRSEEHTSELQSRPHLVCRLLLEKKKKRINLILNKKKKTSKEHKI